MLFYVGFAFCRALNARELIAKLCKVWMEEGQDAHQASVRLERENIHENKAADLHGGMKACSGL